MARTQTSPAGSPSTAGFTLLELVIALAILSLILAVVIPFVSLGTGRAEIKASARAIASELRLARSEAISQARAQTLIFDLQRKRFGQDRDNLANRLPDDVEMTLLTAESERLDQHQAGIRFFPNGSSTGGKVTIATDKLRFEVSVDWLTGKVVIQEPGA